MPGYNTEADYENAIIELFRNDLGYEYVYGPDVERDFRSPLYDTVLAESLYRLNKGLPADAINDALFKLRNFEIPKEDNATRASAWYVYISLCRG